MASIMMVAAASSSAEKNKDLRVFSPVATGTLRLPQQVWHGTHTIEILDQRQVHMLAQVLQTFWAKKPCKKFADLHPRQGNLLHLNIFTGLNKNSLHFTK
jgi:hypothetical protein